MTSYLPPKEPKVEPNNGWLIPVCGVFLSQKEVQYIQEALGKTQISGGGGEFIDKFEKLFAKKTGAAFAVSCNSGTSALHLAFRLIELHAGDEVIVPNFTMVSTVTPLIELGCKPVFIDSDPQGNIDIMEIESKITEKTKAIVATHIYGNPVDVSAIEGIALKHHLKVVYDAAEAHGAMINKRKLGEFGDVVCYSFYANKIITTGEGGMVTMNKSAYMEKAKKLKDEHFSDVRHFWHEDYGYSYRMSNLLAAIGLGQTERWDELTTLKKIIYGTYKEMLEGVIGISFLPDKTGSESARWVVGILIDKEKFGMNKDDLREFLARKGIETRNFFIPMHMQICMQKFLSKSKPSPEDFEDSEKLVETGMYLPCASSLSLQAIGYIVDRIKEATRK